MKIDYNSFIQKYKRPSRHQFPAKIRVYKGYQGNGKTLSMTHDFIEFLKQYPDCHRWSNVKISGVDYNPIESDDDLDRALADANGAAGVVILLDEAHNYFSKKTGISINSLLQVSQNRKTRRYLMMSSQIWEDLDVSLRKQVDEIVKCRSILRKFQFNQVFNGHSLRWSNIDSDWVADKKYSYLFKHYQKLYDSYDTYQKIIHNNETAPLRYQELQKPNNIIISQNSRRKL